MKKNRTFTMICGGCKANLELSGNLLLKIRWGRLHIQCPSCLYIQRCRIDNKGEIILLEKG